MSTAILYLNAAYDRLFVLLNDASTRVTIKKDLKRHRQSPSLKERQLHDTGQWAQVLFIHN